MKAREGSRHFSDSKNNPAPGGSLVKINSAPSSSMLKMNMAPTIWRPKGYMLAGTKLVNYSFLSPTSKEVRSINSGHLPFSVSDFGESGLPSSGSVTLFFTSSSLSSSESAAWNRTKCTNVYPQTEKKTSSMTLLTLWLPNKIFGKCNFGAK